MQYILLGLYLAATIGGVLLLKGGAAETGFAVQHGNIMLNFSWMFLAGFFCYFCSFLLFTMLLSRFNLNYIYPLAAGLVNVAVVLAGVLLFKEKVTIYGILGVGLVIAGVILMNIKQ